MFLKNMPPHGDDVKVYRLLISVDRIRLAALALFRQVVIESYLADGHLHGDISCDVHFLFLSKGG